MVARPLVIIDKVAWVHATDGKVVMTRSHGKDVWYLPGGKPEANETRLETLSREILEELSVEVRVEQSQFLGEFIAPAHGKPERTLVRMACFDAPYRGELTPANEIEAVSWFGYDDRWRVSDVDRVIFDHLLAAGSLQ